MSERTVNALGTLNNEEAAIAYLLSARAIRDRCRILFDLACQQQLRHFDCDLSQLERVADYVIQVMVAAYPAPSQVPFHSRWRHFQAAGVSRLAQLEAMLTGLSPLQKAQAKFDLVIVSVLLDAGAGAWQYIEPETNLVLGHSEGLAVASFRMFCNGAFSSAPNQRLQVDAVGLQQLTIETLARGLQVSDANPLIGLAGRLNLLQHLGRELFSASVFFGDDPPRPGNLVNYFLTISPHRQLAAETILRVILAALGNIWTGRLKINSTNLGDVWYHSELEKYPSFSAIDAGLVPFHKLSQWLTYSLLEPLQELSLEITGLDTLTGLPEYRNGGLCLDLGLLQIKNSAWLQQCHAVDSELIVEWRALTVILLDYIAAAVRAQLGMRAEELPLVKVLQGGTWSAGRKIASKLRNGVPPLHIESDGTVF